ncbi:DUF4105 domain-containing protein [Halobacteriovorax sp. HLS]|uniref:lipoprotein N-acyltransferase Lnb domain-containing protein n=1 Tax=Halobacteriovorax sp. HLS TaxID=2234000 RepID=UPI0013E2CA93|nr:DUF4105 domain-containing protein [Halobacteriovorax sp. HLS]
MISCSKETDPAAEEKFNTSHEKFLNDISKRSKKVLSEDFSFSGVELIYVQSGSIYYQWFGHVFIRFVGSGKTSDEDLGVSFIADFNEYALDNLKAYYGGYTVLPVVDKWENYVRDYTKVEKRYIDRYIFPTTLEQRNDLKKALKSWIKDPSIPGSYSFRRNGCTALLLKLIATFSKDIDSSKVLFPIEVVHYLQQKKKLSFRYERILPENYNNLKNVINLDKDYQL